MSETIEPQERKPSAKDKEVDKLSLTSIANADGGEIAKLFPKSYLQDIKRLFLTAELHREQFLDLKVGPNGDEARAYLAQMKVFDELTHSMGSGGFYGEYFNDRGEVNLVNLADIYHNQGREAFVKYLMEEAKSPFSIGDQVRARTYRQYYDLMYDRSFSPFADFYHQQKNKYRALDKNGSEKVKQLINAGF